MATEKWYLRYPKSATITPQLRKTVPKPGLVDPARYSLLEEEADRLLEEAGLLEPKTRTRDGAGRYVFSIREGTDQEITPQETSLWSDDAAVSELMSDLTEVCALRPREETIVRAIVDGAVWGPHTGGYSRLADQLSTTPGAVKKAWSQTRAKLIEHWTGEDEGTYVRPKVKSSKQGHGFTLVVGADRAWGQRPEVYPAPVTVSQVSDADWKYRPALDPDGWPLA